MQTRIVLIGAGSAQFGFGTLGDIFQSQVLPGSHIVLHDINPQTLAKVEAVGQQFIQEHELPYTLSATTSRPEALQGADFCVISIEVGDRFALWEQDWRIPQQYGIRQVYGENGGPGGLFHSLRIIPPILEICADVQKICPEAYVINFSNPMSRICTTVCRKYPDLRFIGLCHEIFSVPYYLPLILDTPFENLSVRAGGLNHFSVLLEATYKDTGQDAYPDIRHKVPAYLNRLLSPAQADGGTWTERGLFKVILEKFGYMPITTDSHFGEYIQWAYDVVDHKGILGFYHAYKRSTVSHEPTIKLRLTERVVPIVEGILTDSGHEELAVNLPNKGLIDNLPEFIVVEVPAIVDKNGVHGVPLGELPKGFAGLLYNQVAVHDMTAEAVLTGSREAALQALLVDPVVDKVEAAEQLLDTMLELQKEYLGYIK
jgi:alpha-galactosidase